MLYAYRSTQGMRLEHGSRIDLVLLYVCMLAISLAVSICVTASSKHGVHMTDLVTSLPPLPHHLNLPH